MRHPLGKADLPEGGMRGHELPGGQLVLLVRQQGWWALDDWCNHAGCLLSQGKLRGFRVICPCHDMEFDVRTGALCCLPRLCQDQPAYRAVVEGEEVFVELD